MLIRKWHWYDIVSFIPLVIFIIYVITKIPVLIDKRTCYDITGSGSCQSETIILNLGSIFIVGLLCLLLYGTIYVIKKAYLKK